MFFSISLYIALIIFGLGLVYKARGWFCLEIGLEARTASFPKRVGAAARGVLGTVFSARLLRLLQVFILDVILQRRILKEDFTRWFMHICIYGGFMLLLLMHALGSLLTISLFPDYASTLNPFMFLRNLFGVLVIVGLVIAFYRRRTVRGLRLTTRPLDRYALVILAVIMVSGFLLEATKIVSHVRFTEMVEDYADVDEESDIKALKAYWAKEFDVVFPAGKDLEKAAPPTLERGGEIHEESCAACHSRPGWAFISFPAALGLKPAALVLTGAGAQQVLWYIHFLACFLGLAYLPFSKFLHILTSPLSLLVNGVIDPDRAEAANLATRRALELDACTHCGTCSQRCSVGPVFQYIGNLKILPSEKLIGLKSLASNGGLGRNELTALQEASFICTSCYRCTTVCPVGINLQDLWLSLKDDLAGKGYPEPFAAMAGTVTAQFSAGITDRESILTLGGQAPAIVPALSERADTFANCFTCQTCSNVCPVVANYEDPAKALGLLPHQIMHSLGLGLREMVLGARMAWDCLTCYACQEQCPQGVQVTDILYELKNMAARQVKEQKS